MNIQSANFLVEVAANNGIDAELYEGYSGRGMYGEETTGVTTENPVKLLGLAIAFALDIDRGEAEEFGDCNFTRLQFDSLGRGSIIY